jgi:glycosyltransferase involved in cell wall biosynthesis
MQKVIEGAGMMTAARKEMFAGMYLDAAERLADRVSRKEAREIWWDAFLAGVITKRQRLQGLQYFRLFRWEGMRRSRRRWLERIWPANFFVRTGPDYLRTPVVRGELPAISVVMSAYNAETYLNEAIDSIVTQTLGDWEFIIIDDGSTDGTLGILREYEKRDKRFRIISRANTGLTKALNEGVAAARGEFIARMDADDVSMPRRFEWQVAYLREHPQCVLLGGQVELIDPLGLRIGMDSHQLTHEEIEAGLLRGKGGAVVHPATMMRADAVKKIGVYREHFNNSEDLDLFLRLAEAGQIANLPEVLLKYRRHPQSVSHLKYENQWKLNRQIVSEAYERRGGKLPADWEFVPWKPKAMSEQLREWAWAALKAGKVKAARRHAASAVRKAPMSMEAWRVMYCALRGR